MFKLFSLYLFAHFEVGLSVVNLLQSYLLNGQSSSFYKVTSDVPQESVLGPILILIYVNDVSHPIRNSSCLLYVDDNKIFKEIHLVNDCCFLQSDLCSLSEWYHKNNLCMNTSKT